MFLELLLLVFILNWVRIWNRRRKCKPNYHNKTVWITGASSGIGEFLAYEFSRCGADLIISARNLGELERVKSRCANPQKVRTVKLDMTEFDTVQAVTKKII